MSSHAQLFREGGGGALVFNTHVSECHGRTNKIGIGHKKDEISMTVLIFYYFCTAKKTHQFSL